MILKQGDCLELMKDIPNKSVDMILCDLPYGITRNEWDKVIDIPSLWKQYKRIIKSGGAILLFSKLPFACDLINGNRKWFRYEWVWDKASPVGFLNANRMPMAVHENILVFYDRLPLYNPQKEYGHTSWRTTSHAPSKNYGSYNSYVTINLDGSRYPRDIIRFSNGDKRKNVHFHPTQKPVDLLEYLIKTYTNEGDIVLDNCMGSGSTGVACVNTGRDFIGFELDENYFKIAEQRILSPDNQDLKIKSCATSHKEGGLHYEGKGN